MLAAARRNNIRQGVGIITSFRQTTSVTGTNALLHAALSATSTSCTGMCRTPKLSAAVELRVAAVINTLRLGQPYHCIDRICIVT